MKLWKISQTENTDYDTYDSAIVAAETEEEAKKIHPYDSVFSEYNNWEPTYGQGNWCSSPEKVTCELIGEAKPGTESGVILASFNAG